MAVRLLQLRAVARLNPELPATESMPEEIVRVVAYLAQVPVAQLTTQQCWYTIAGQGGYLGRRGDGPAFLENALVWLVSPSDSSARHPSSLFISFPINFPSNIGLPHQIHQKNALSG